MKEIDQANISEHDVMMTEANVENSETSDDLWMYHEDLIKDKLRMKMKEVKTKCQLI